MLYYVNKVNNNLNRSIESNVGIYVIIWYIRRNLVYFDIFFVTLRYIVLYYVILLVSGQSPG